MKFSFARKCGTARGSVGLGSLDGASFRARGKARIGRKRARASVSGQVSRDGSMLSGELKVRAAGSCPKARRGFTLRYAEPGQAVIQLRGDYVGVTSEGLPVTLTVGSDRETGLPVVENVAWDQQLECVSVLDPRPPLTELVGHLEGLTGPLSQDGSFELDVYDEGSDDDPYDDVDYEVFGSLDATRATGEFAVGDARFDPLGLLNPLALLQCWESTLDEVTFEAFRG